MKVCKGTQYIFLLLLMATFGCKTKYETHSKPKLNSVGSKLIRYELNDLRYLFITKAEVEALESSKVCAFWLSRSFPHDRQEIYVGSGKYLDSLLKENIHTHLGNQFKVISRNLILQTPVGEVKEIGQIRNLLLNPKINAGDLLFMEPVK